MHVLILDDDYAFAELVRETVLDALEGATTVTLAHTGDGGMDAVRNTETIDLAILDIGLPGPSGILVAQRLRAKNAQALIVMVTGSEPGEAEVIRQQAKADLVLGKANFIEGLVRAIETRLHRRKE